MGKKHMTDRTISVRAVNAIEDRCRCDCVSLTSELNRIGLKRKSFYAWKRLECAPSVYALQGMAVCGYDVVQILKGY